MPFTSRSTVIIGEQTSVSVKFGGNSLTNASPTWDVSGQDFSSIANSAKLNISVATVDTAGLTDTTQRLQVTKASGTLDIELMVDKVNGPIFFGKEGFYCQITILGWAGGSTTKVFSGVLTGLGESNSKSDASTESATIVLGVNGISGGFYA